MMKIDFLKKKIDYKKKHFTFNPQLFWQIILCFTLVMVVAAFFFGFNLYMQTEQEANSSVLKNTEQPAPYVDKSRIEKVLGYFSNREKNSDQILNSSSTVADPSL